MEILDVLWYLYMYVLNPELPLMGRSSCMCIHVHLALFKTAPGRWSVIVDLCVCVCAVVYVGI